jgi:hypothetical protein
MEVVTHILESADGGTNQNGRRNRASSRHSPTESADGGTSENGKRNRPKDGHSLTGERRQRNKSEWQKTQNARWALTF